VNTVGTSTGTGRIVFKGFKMEIVYFEGAIIGLAQRIPCKVRAIRAAADENWTDSDHAIIEDTKTDKLPDGDYDLQIDGRQLPLKRMNGKFSLRQ
jgi:hypothetical protein